MKKTALLVLGLSIWWLTAAAKAENRYPFDIGVIVPLSGPLAYVGEDIRDGMELAVETLPKDAAEFRLHFEDSRHDLKQSVSAAQKLLNVDHVDMLVSLWDCADVVAPLTEQKKKLHMAIRWNPDIAARYHYTFTIESTYRSYTRDQLKLLRLLGVKTIAIIQAEASGWLLAGEEAQRSAPEFGITVSGAESFVQGETDFRPILLKLLRGGPDYVLIESLPPDTQNILRQLREISPGQRHLGYYEVLDDPKIIGEDVFVGQFAASDEFAEAFQRRFGHPFRIRAAHAHALIELLNFAMRKLNLQQKPSADQLIPELMAVRDFPSAIGPLSVGPQRTIENPDVIEIRQDGRFQPFAKN